MKTLDTSILRTRVSRLYETYDPTLGYEHAIDGVPTLVELWDAFTVKLQRAGWRALYGAHAPARKRPRRVQRKIDARLGYARCPESTAQQHLRGIAALFRL